MITVERIADQVMVQDDLPADATGRQGTVFEVRARPRIADRRMLVRRDLESALVVRPPGAPRPRIDVEGVIATSSGARRVLCQTRQPGFGGGVGVSQTHTMTEFV